MQNPSPRRRRIRNFLTVAATVLAAGALAGHAFAECDEGAEDMAGKAIATAATAKISSAVTLQGKQMLSLDECNITGGGLYITFKYNVIGTDGLYWIQGSAKVRGSDVTELKVTQMSSNLAAATAAKGIKLAAN